MRSVLALGLLITLCAPANAATVHRFKQPEDHLRPGHAFCVGASRREEVRDVTPASFSFHHARSLLNERQG
jgi:hypothetical protein